MPNTCARMRAFRILVVDDSPAVCRFVELAVGSRLVHVVGAVDAHAALAKMREARVDLALVATAFTGVAACDLMAGLADRRVPVSLLSGHLDQTGVDTTLATAGVLAKPLQVDHLRDLVDRTMDPRPLDARCDADPIESWMTDADTILGFTTRAWRGLADDAQVLSRFQHDVSASRAQPAPRRLSVKPSQHA